MEDWLYNTGIPVWKFNSMIIYSDLIQLLNYCYSILTVKELLDFFQIWNEGLVWFLEDNMVCSSARELYSLWDGRFSVIKYSRSTEGQLSFDQLPSALKMPLPL
jgi:hypothetical protein